MSTDVTVREPGGAATLFQKAHGKMVMLQRLDAQLAGLLEQRRKVQDELTGLQAQINEEFERIMRQADEAPARLLAEMAESSGRTAALPQGSGSRESH